MRDARLLFSSEYSEADELEASIRGYYVGAVVELSSGLRCPVTFYDPVRLQQTIDDYLRLGRACFAEPGLIVVPEVTRERMEAAVRELSRGDFFPKDPS